MESLVTERTLVRPRKIWSLVVGAVLRATDERRQKTDCCRGHVGWTLCGVKVR
jgi:hypothetical protein